MRFPACEVRGNQGSQIPGDQEPAVTGPTQVGGIGGRAGARAGLEALQPYRRAGDRSEMSIAAKKHAARNRSFIPFSIRERRISHEPCFFRSIFIFILILILTLLSILNSTLNPHPYNVKLPPRLRLCPGGAAAAASVQDSNLFFPFLPIRAAQQRRGYGGLQERHQGWR